MDKRGTIGKMHNWDPNLDELANMFSKRESFPYQFMLRDNSSPGIPATSGDPTEKEMWWLDNLAK